MGEFSYMCKKCKTSIRASERCILFLIEDSKIIDIQNGVYSNAGYCEEHAGEDGMESWCMSWSGVHSLMFRKDKHNGIGAYHESCWNGELPTIRSNDDPEQGWQDTRDRFLERKDISKYLTDKLRGLLFLNGL